MVNLPEIQPRGSVTRAPQSSLSAAEIANPYQQIANAFDALGENFKAAEQEKAVNNGQQAVYRDQQGNLKVDFASNFSDMGRLYNRSAKASLLAAHETELSTAALKLSNEAKGNPEAFLHSWKGLGDQMLTNADPQMRGPLRTLIDKIGGEQQLGLIKQKYETDMTKAKASFIDQRQLLVDQLGSLAYSGGTGTPEYRSTLEKIKSLNGELTGNPVFQYDQREADVEMKRIEGRATGEAIVGMSHRAIQSGGIVEAQKFRDQLMNDQNLPFSMQERRFYAGLVEEEMHGFVAQQKAAQEPLKEKTKLLRDNLNIGTGFDDPELQDHIRALARAGNPEEALKLQHDAEIARSKYDLRHASPEQQVAMAENAIGNENRPAPSRNRPVNFNPDATGRMQEAMAHYKARGLDPIRSAAIIGQLVQESGINPNAINKGDGTDGSDSIGIAQWNGDRARALKSFAAARGASPNDLGTQLDFVLEELKTSENGTYQRLMAATTVEEATAAMMGYERPQGWSPDNPRGGSGWSNRLAAASKAAQLAGVDAKLMGVTQAQTIDPEMRKEYQQTLSQQVRDFWPDIEAGIKSGIPMTDQQLGLLTRQLAIIDDPELSRKTADLLTANQAISDFSEASPEAMQSAIDMLRSDMSAHGANALQADILAGYEASQKATREALAKDPQGYGLARRLLKSDPPFDPSQPDTWPQTFRGMQTNVDILKSAKLVGNISALRPNVQQSVQQVLSSSSPRDAVQLLGAMHDNMSAATYKATLGSIYSSGDGKGAAAAGALVGVNPSVAEGVLRGQALLKENPLLAPKKTDENKAATDEILNPEAFAPFIEGSRQQLIDAATARYADLSNQTGDTSGEFNETRMTQAITEVTGGMLELNGAAVVAPRYGMAQADFDKLIYGLKSADLGGAMTVSGNPVKAEDLQSQGRLRAVADGMYMLEFGPPDAPTYALQRPSPGSYGQPSAYILDLRGK